MKRATRRVPTRENLSLGTAALAIILSATSIALHVKMDSAFMTALSSISTAVAAVVGVFVLLAARQSLVTSRGVLDEMRKQREAADRPIISISSTPEPRRPGVLNLRVANTGKGPAYDISVRFSPDIPWGESTINQTKIVSGIPVLDGGDRIEFFLAAAERLQESDYPDESTADVTYYRVPAGEEREPLTTSVRVLLGAWRGYPQIRLKDIHELVEEIEDLKHALLIALQKEQEKRNGDSADN